MLPEAFRKMRAGKSNSNITARGAVRNLLACRPRIGRRALRQRFRCFTCTAKERACQSGAVSSSAAVSCLAGRLRTRSNDCPKVLGAPAIACASAAEPMFRSGRPLAEDARCAKDAISTSASKRRNVWPSGAPRSDRKAAAKPPASPGASCASDTLEAAPPLSSSSKARNASHLSLLSRVRRLSRKAFRAPSVVGARALRIANGMPTS
mmetsp:Transcript_115374/g.337344  ORF Transcript_115374/g.337344 Transcript_115374/m.337344 type:complete len:208 (+) Transcript_115374:134-757(+)